MNIRDIRALKHTASQRLGAARDTQKILLIYGGITVALPLLVTVINYVLGLQISQAGGLSSIGTRTILSTIRTVLPMVQTLALMCLDMGFLAAMLRISRGQYTSPQTLRAGIQRFWTLLRSALLQSFVYMGLSILSFYLAIQIYLFTPLSKEATEILLPLTGTSDPTALLDEATQLQLMEAMIPMFVLALVFMIVLFIPVAYRFRMTNYVILDKPGLSAMAALRASMQMMRKNCFHLFRVDLSLWWYHVLTALTVVVCYGDSILSLMGVTLPWSADVSYFLFYGLYLAALFVITYFLRSRVEVTYALAYEAIRPKETTNGVVLGNIFNM